MDLDSYLQGDYLSDKRDLSRLDNRRGAIAEGFGTFFDEDKATWPYEVLAKGIEHSLSYSFSTTAMITHALAASIGLMPSSILAPSLPAGPKSDDPLRPMLRRATSELIARSMALGSGRVAESGTFGRNDPMTLAWMTELSKCASSELRLDEGLVVSWQERLSDCADALLLAAFANPTEPILKFEDANVDAVPHTFPLLRAIQLRSALERDKPEPQRVLDHLVLTIHLELSFSEIPNSSFDAAELAFALEAALLLDADAVELSLIDRVFAVLDAAQQDAPCWRPLRPLRVNPRGEILLPQSVEMANSLLRVCRLLDARTFQSDERSYFSENIQLFRRYETWLDSRLVTGTDAENRRFRGWQSDHTYVERRVHLWHTSQALLFLVHYQRTLQEHVARTARVAGGFSTKYFDLASHDPDGEWQKALSFEPMAGLPPGSRYRIYERADSTYVKARRDPTSDQVAHCSILLSGPPGTGKTTFAEELAKALSWGLITLTPSDFIERGEAGVEARARSIFKALNEQKDFVILFDEIDRLVLDRDSPDYGAQSEMFQFMTPGMLTKLNDLRKTGNVIFIIATNYAERIDSAITRAGRIDDHLLLLPPDQSARRTHFARLLKGSAADDEALLDELGRFTALYTYKEVEYLVGEAERVATRDDGAIRDAVLEGAKSSIPALSLTGYEARFSDNDEATSVAGPLRRSSGGPVEEFLMLVYLVSETGTDPELSEVERDLLGQCRIALGNLHPEQSVLDVLDHVASRGSQRTS
jgi:hypothetical protein